MHIHFSMQFSIGIMLALSLLPVLALAICALHNDSDQRDETDIEIYNHAVEADCMLCVQNYTHVFYKTLQAWHTEEMGQIIQ